ncbi:WD40 repeat domain-containing protein [Streptomyces milbemycinicus]|uniref:WD40 repeat domain-containing protein n=2 Tax=Streptomyces milbemycinicus TaxID=476552 RepID=A0ABW8LVW3_9ACTN
MSTDMYGVRVLSVDRERLRARFQVFVVYYDTQGRTHAAIPDDPTFFFFLLWEGASGRSGTPGTGPLRQLVDTRTALDFAWVDAHARRFVSAVERIATRNHPPTARQWERLHDFYYERDGAWQDEDLLVQCEYEVTVTDRRWLEPLREGAAWGTAAFPLIADIWTAVDAPHIPDLAGPAVTLRPFDSATGDLAFDHLLQVEFSDDGKYLAVCSDQNRVWVYDTADWSEVLHTSAGDEWIVPVLMWVPGEHILTVKTYPQPEDAEVEPQWAFDVDARAETEVPFQGGKTRSRDGAYRLHPNDARDGGYDLLATERSPRRRVAHADSWDPIQCESFSGDGSRLFLGAQENLYVVDPATGEVVDKVMDASERLFQLESSPDGSYLVVNCSSRKLSYLHEGQEGLQELCVWRMADKEIVMGRQLTTWVEGLSWSPDGRWLAALLEPRGEDDFHNGRTELALFAMGPSDD